MKKLVTAVLGALLFASSYASQYMVVMCNMNPATATTLTAAISDPNTGAMSDVASCGIALSMVPANYTLKTTSYAGSSDASFVNYLFEAN